MFLFRGAIRNMMFSSDPRKIRQMSEDSVSKLEDVCRAGVKSGHQGGFIYPGTKWCGPGNIALNYTDLGYHFKEDMCCREHDNCKTFLNAGECKQGICNTSPYTRQEKGLMVYYIYLSLSTFLSIFLLNLFSFLFIFVLLYPHPFQNLCLPHFFP